MSKVKQVILMRTDLNMRRGKQIAQGAHASLAVILNMGTIGSNDEGLFETTDVVNEDYSTGDYYKLNISSEENPYIYKWITGAFTKVCVVVSSEEELDAILEKAKAANLPHVKMIDNGDTEFHGKKTATCGCIGPAPAEKIDPITGHLKLY